MVDGIGSMNSLAAAKHGKQGNSATWGWPLKVNEIVFPVPNHFSMDWVLFLCFAVFLFCFFVYFFAISYNNVFLFVLSIVANCST